jgi:hypothetical protein
MIALLRRVGPGMLALLGACLALAACIATDGEYYGDGAVGYGGYYSGGYVEPFGYDYGAWGRGYHVGPGRGGDRGHDRASPAYHPAPAGHRSPSIPSRSRKR